MWNKFNGEETNNQEEYLDSWTIPAKIVGEKLGLELGGFDPGFMFHDNKMKNSISLPAWFVEKLLNALEE